eukprot:TRINITY_DN7088_c0_g1_i1.p1 TRINITY_DN7088_c0_g1~~TRINITY_DN7088_c0_g1_i1.p1  ORF type:complete len:220 (+),score=42.20 TRINITY_DN7088_c0_g1_i1:89-748(+)
MRSAKTKQTGNKQEVPHLEWEQPDFGRPTKKEKEKPKKVSQEPENTIVVQPTILSDTGVCLSMHQPWASLLVYGIKRIEGRSWSTDYRGILWIHAASKKPEPELIRSMELEYEGTTYLPYPKYYPTSVLLGYVEMIECLSREELSVKARTTTPTSDLSLPNYNEENDSDFAFVCVNPHRLVIPMEMSGHHKLWKLPKHLYKTAKQGALPITANNSNDVK